MSTVAETFEQWCKEWQGPPYPSLSDCIADQYSSTLELYWEAIRHSVDLPRTLEAAAWYEWITNLLLMPGRIFQYSLIVAWPDYFANLGTGVESLYGWTPVLASGAIYALLMCALAWAWWRRRRDSSAPSHSSGL